MAERDALGALTVAVGDLRREVGAVAAVLAQLVAGQEAHTALLDALLSAVADLGEDAGGDGLALTLGRLADSLDAQGETLAAMSTGLAGIPVAVATALRTSPAT